MTVPMIKSIGDVPYPIDTHSDAFSPLLTTGAALGITGNGPTESAAWLQRVSTSDGPTTVKSIHGNTVRWNQLVTFSAGSEVNRGVTFTRSADGTVTANGTASDATYDSYLNCTPINSVSSHKYLLRGCPSGGSVGTYYLRDGYSSLTETFDTGNGVIISPHNASSLIVQVNIIKGTTVTDLVFRPQLFDLTQMFGAGNEPSTVAEFEALYPLPYYPYDAGSLLSVNMEGIESTAADESWTQTRSVPAGTLRGAGSVYDELTETQAIHRVYEVVLDGSQSGLRYAVNASGGSSGNMTVVTVMGSNWVSEGLPQPLKGGEYLSRTSVKCDKLPTMSTMYNTWTGKGISGWPDTSAAFIFAPTGDNSITTETELVAWLSQNPLTIHYALATPTTTPIDLPLNLTYRTEQGGTERVIIPTGEQSAPPTIVTAQGYTAESLRDAALSAIAPVENGLASTNYGVGSYLVHGGQLCKVTTAIATGEAVTIGTNVVTTTVMAEVISLTQ